MTLEINDLSAADVARAGSETLPPPEQWARFDEGFCVNRTVFRGVIAVFVSGAIAAGAGVVGTALAAGPDMPDVRAGSTPAVLALDLPKKPLPVARRMAPAPAPAPKRVSRASRRIDLLGSPRTIAHALLLRRGWSESQWTCLDALWTRESNWDVTASNGRSGAYGIPQALPGWKMAAAGSDWRTNPLTQIQWGLGYIGRAYGSPCGALAHSDRYGYY